ncbi:uncharacterized protein OCT59_014700 [Rhizophagus irregularis]|uniref:uncharacterized protein n=1 Tax=Rhizophagus irregularis TaxID=588596 RepID=UPI003318C2D0|nr:hypothetical protein OCT59_014700 [Rhizophagus irregularis]
MLILNDPQTYDNGDSLQTHDGRESATIPNPQTHDGRTSIINLQTHDGRSSSSPPFSNHYAKITNFE